MGGPMRTAPLTTTLPADRRKGFFVHQIQKGYAAWMGLLLFLYSALFFTLAFYGAHLQPLLALYGGGSLEERQAAAKEMLMLSETVWVAVPILFFGAVIFSLILTRRVAGPLYRLDQSMQRWAQGDLRWRMRFRPSDRLDGLAECANHAVESIEQSMASIQHQASLIRAGLSKMEQTESPVLIEVRQATDQIDELVRQYMFIPLSESQTKRR